VCPGERSGRSLRKASGREERSGRGGEGARGSVPGILIIGGMRVAIEGRGLLGLRAGVGSVVNVICEAVVHSQGHGAVDESRWGEVDRGCRAVDRGGGMDGGARSEKSTKGGGRP